MLLMPCKEENMARLVEHGLELIRRTSTDLSSDVESRLMEARDAEEGGSTARSTFDVILENVKLAREGGTPICQDTGLPAFYVKMPAGQDQGQVKSDLVEAVRLATAEGLLRPNAVNPIDGKNSGDNVGRNLPYIAIEIHEGDEIIVDLMQKGGGSENVGAQYRLPDPRLNAGRDLDGVEKCILDAVFEAQGFGCAPGTIGICIGGDRGGSFYGAKKQLLRKMDDTNPDPELADLEERLYLKLNKLGIGPMGFGGRTTVLGVKAGYLHRHPASFFVSMAYCCWANRRRRLTIRGDEVEIA